VIAPGNDLYNHSALSKDYAHTPLKGRYFDEHDYSKSTLVAVIDSNLARDYFADQDPIGRHITIQVQEISLEMEVIGVVDT